MFISRCTSTYHLSHSEPDRSSQCSHTTFWRSILTLSSHLCLCLLCGLFPSGLKPKVCRHFCSTILVTCPAHYILLNLIIPTILGEEFRSISSSLCSFIYSPITSSIKDTNIIITMLFSNTLRLRSYLTVSDHVSHPYNTKSKIIDQYILILNLLRMTTIQWLPSHLNLLLNRIFICLGCSHILERNHTFKEAIMKLYIVTSSWILI
jgi:hypothetical protein